MHCSGMRGALAQVFGISHLPTRALQAPSRATTLPSRISSPTTSIAQFSTSQTREARAGGAAGSGKKAGRQQTDRRITLIRYHLHHPSTLTPRPLRFSRNRYLRHWTIHRAWNLYQHKLSHARERELERQYNAMSAANEELRVGAGDGGRLFRKAQMKTGTWGLYDAGRMRKREEKGLNAETRGLGGVPIEYARGGLVDFVGSVEGTGRGGRAKVWDGEWRRS